MANIKYEITEDNKTYTLHNAEKGLVYITNESGEAVVINSERIFAMIQYLFESAGNEKNETL